MKKNDLKKHATFIYNLLEKHYPNAKMILNWGNNFELLVAIILSAQCTDKKVNEVTEKMFPKYKNLKLKSKENAEKIKLNFEIEEIINFAKIPLSEIEKDIKPTGFYHNKAKSLQNAAKYILEHFNGILPKNIDEMIKISGVGRKTANVFLGNAYGIVEGIAVDTHVTKQAQILGLTKNTTPEKIEKELMDLYPKDKWFKLTYLLIEHGRYMRMAKDKRKKCNNKNCILCEK